MNFDNMNYYSWDVEELEDGIALVKAEILRLGGIPQAEELEVTQDEDVVSDDEEKQREVVSLCLCSISEQRMGTVYSQRAIIYAVELSVACRSVYIALLIRC